MLGVNLIYACNYYYEYPNIFLKSLLDNLTIDRFRITMMRMSGPELDYVDNRLLGVQLVKNGMTRAIMFDEDGNKQITSKDLNLPDATKHLYNYLQDCLCILDIKSNMSDQLQIKSHEVLKMIQEGDKRWEKYVPLVVAIR